MLKIITEGTPEYQLWEEYIKTSAHMTFHAQAIHKMNTVMFSKFAVEKYTPIIATKDREIKELQETVELSIQVLAAKDIELARTIGLLKSEIWNNAYEQSEYSIAVADRAWEEFMNEKNIVIP